MTTQDIISTLNEIKTKLGELSEQLSAREEIKSELAEMSDTLLLENLRRAARSTHHPVFWCKEDNSTFEEAAIEELVRRGKAGEIYATLKSVWEDSLAFKAK